MTRDDLLTFDSITQPISEWALDYGITVDIIIARLERGLSVERAIITPMHALPGQRLPKKDQVKVERRKTRSQSRPVSSLDRRGWS